MKEKKEKVLAGYLMGKILLTRGVHKEGLKMALQQVWRTIKEVKIESLGVHIFMFKFADEADKRRVMTGGPWHFDRALIVLTEPKGIGEIIKQSFTHTTFWVQIQNVPVACLERYFLQELGGKIRIVKEVETDEYGKYIGEFIRVRISIKMTQPLEKILQEGDADILMSIDYERLPDFYFICGVISH